MCSSNCASEMFAAGASTWDVKDAGDAARQQFLAEELGLASPRRRRAVGGGAGGPAPVHVRPGVDRRSARRHPRVRRARPPRLGGARRAVGPTAPSAVRGQPAGRRPDVRHRPRAGRAADRRATGRASSRRARAPRTPRCSSPRRSAATPCGSARPAPRRCRSCSARPTSTSTTAACTSGTRPHRPRSRSPPGLHVSRLDGSPLVYNERDPWLPDFIVCRPELADAGAHARSGADRLRWTRATS